ncbi:ATP synthase subunit I [Pasteurella canis]|uniref:ATP synthase subunit I n=1 Tax=Pasteurella canis TaxID=753 RepID=A0A379EWL5_9PAST|nr:ATP synthase subunit I [Pasteurella canis]UEA16492.1 ATP synthase subunit I [Pasteurella canis]SPY34175.1 ATP synthase subunit I [Pasteurella canis]SUC10775.1 ATP synthase subunit I [Pasteurella canis]
MSRVIAQAKKKYKISIIAECFILLITALVLMSWQWQTAISFYLGAMAIFLPYCVFVFLVFFRKKQQFSNKITYFYYGEGIKFLLTIVCIIATFKFFSSMQPIAFFSGYFIAIILNNILPFLVDKYVKI